MVQRWKAILFILFFTPFFAESIASTSAPWYLFFNPTVLLLMALLYGTSALVMRELLVRQKFGFSNFVVYGALFAGLNEGIVANTWFKEHALDFTNSELVRIYSVNWHLVVNHTIFHTLFSMLIPILLSFIIFPRLNQVRLLNQKWLTVCGGFLLFIVIANLAPKENVAVANFSHRLSLSILLIAGAAFSLLVASRQKYSSVSRSYTSKNLLAMGIGFSTLFVVSYFILPNFLAGWSLILSLALFAIGILGVYRIKDNISHDPPKAIPLIAGLMLPSLVLSFAKLSIFQPMIVLLFLAYLLWLYEKARNNSPLRPNKN